MFANISAYLMPDVAADFHFYGFAIGFFGLLAATGLILSMLKKRMTMQYAWSRLMIVMGAIGLIVYLFRYEEVPYFDNSLILWLFFASITIWVGWLAMLHFTRVPRVVAIEKEKQIKSKYLPKSKKQRKK